MFREKWIQCVLKSGMDFDVIGAVLLLVPYVSESGRLTQNDRTIARLANAPDDYVMQQIATARTTPFVAGQHACIPSDLITSHP
jgi:hypothetical protein